MLLQIPFISFLVVGSLSIGWGENESKTSADIWCSDVPRILDQSDLLAAMTDGNIRAVDCNLKAIVNHILTKGLCEDERLPLPILHLSIALGTPELINRCHALGSHMGLLLQQVLAGEKRQGDLTYDYARHSRLSVGQIVNLLVENGLDVDSTVNNRESDTNGFSFVKAVIYEYASLRRNKIDTSTIHRSFVSLELIEALLQHGASPTSSNSDGIPALQYATILGLPEVVQLLLRYGAHVNGGDIIGSTALHYLVELGPDAEKDEELWIKLAKILLSHDIDINGQNENGRTALFLAALHGRHEAVKFLLAEGADPNMGDEDGMLPLHVAVDNGYIDIVQLLVEYGAIITKTNSKGASPLDWAREVSQINEDDQRGEILSLLENLGKGGITLSETHTSLLRELCELDRNLQVVWTTSPTNESEEFMQQCLSLTKDLNLKASLFHMVNMGNSRDLRKALSSESGARLLASSDATAFVLLLLQAALLSDEAEEIVSLLVREASRHKSVRTSLLHLAVSAGNIDLARLLLKVACEIDDVDEEGNSALHLAVLNSDAAMVTTLLDYWPDTRKTNVKGLTSYDLASARIRNAGENYGQLNRIMEELNAYDRVRDIIRSY